MTNSGTISGNTFGIEAATAANVSNAGTISGGPAALQFVGASDTLTLLAGSHIVGAINLGGGGDTVNFRGGNHNLTFDTLAGATVTGTTPFVVSGNRAVAVDPTPFAMADRNLMDFSRTISAVIPDIGTVGTGGGAPPLAFAGSGRSAADVVGDAFAAAIPGLSAYAGEAAVFNSPTAVYAGGTAVWARGFAGRRVQDADGVLLRTVNRFCVSHFYKFGCKPHAGDGSMTSPVKVIDHPLIKHKLSLVRSRSTAPGQLSPSHPRDQLALCL